VTIYDHKISTVIHKVLVLFLKPGGGTARAIGVTRKIYPLSAPILALLAFRAQQNC